MRVPRAGAVPPQVALWCTPTATRCRKFIPADQANANKDLILGFGGNAWNGQDVAEYLHELFPDEDIAVFHYAGTRRRPDRLRPKR